MAVKLLDAIAAAKALHGSVKQLVKNVQLHDTSHWSKEKAQAEIAGGKPVCGYYWKKLVRDKWTRSTDGDVRYEKPTQKRLKKYNKTTETSYLPINANGCWILVSHALKCAKNDEDTLFVEGNTATRFVIGTPFPADYGGETLRDDDNNEACTRVAVVIATGGNVNTQLVTHFPVAGSFFNNKTVLN